MSQFVFPARLVTGGGVATVTAFNAGDDNPVKVANENHPNFRAILDGLRSGDPDVWDLFDVATGMVKRFRKITDRVSYDGANNCILLDGDPVHSALTDQVMRMLEAGQDGYEPIVKFWEHLETNPHEHSRTQAYDWLASHKFKIYENGYLVAYKGVRTTSDPEVFQSTTNSKVPGKPSAYIDGEPVPERSVVPYKFGTVVTMPRSEVMHDPNQTCARGLHVGDWSYARGYGNAVLEVRVNPRDIVSVPTDAGGRKVRVCRLEVVGAITAEHEGGPIYRPVDETDSWNDVGYDGV